MQSEAHKLAAPFASSSSYTQLTEWEIARALMHNEAWAIAAAWYRFMPMVLRLAERSLGSRLETEDVAQEVFWRVFRKIGKLQDPSYLRNFIYSFTVRVLRRELRRRRARAWLSFGSTDALDQVPGAELPFESLELLCTFHSLLDRLSTTDRLVFVLRRMEAMTVDEIAGHMSLSVSTVKRSLSRSAERLSRWIGARPELGRALEVKKGRHARAEHQSIIFWETSQASSEHSLHDEP